MGDLNTQKITFADIYRLLETARAALKEIGKSAPTLLATEDWETVSATVNEIATNAAITARCGVAVRTLCETFLAGGPYPGESAGVSPLERLGRDA